MEPDVAPGAAERPAIKGYNGDDWGAAALAAIMSTGDAFLNLGAAALARDLPRALGRPGFRSLGAARFGSLAVALAALAVAALHLAGGDLIAFLGTLGFGTFAAALAPTLLLGLAWDRVTAHAAAASMAAGLAKAGAFAVLVARSLLSPTAPLSARTRIALTL